MTGLVGRRPILAYGLALLGLAGTAAPLLAAAKTGLVFIGMHGDKIHAARFDEKTGDLSIIGPVAINARPTWGLRHPTLPIIWFNEDRGASGPSVIQTLRVDRNSGVLTKLAETQSGGGSTQMWLDWPSRTMLVANFGEGSLTALPILQDGTLGAVESRAAFIGSGPHRRQTSSHAHGVTLDPGGRFVLVSDLGADRVWVLPFDRKTRQIGGDDPAQSRHMVMDAGSGPRHLAFHPSGRWLYVIEELSANLSVLGWNAKSGRLNRLQTLPTDDPAFTGNKSAAEVAVSRDGRFVYISNRGDHALVVHSVDRSTGMLKQIQRIASGGPWPWHFVVHNSGKWLIVANRDADSLNVFSVDARSGKLTNSGKKLTTPKPVHVLLSGF